MNACDSRAGRTTLASSSATAVLLIGRDLRALSRMARVHVTRGTLPCRVLAAQLKAVVVAPLSAWWPAASIAAAQSVAHEGRRLVACWPDDEGCWTRNVRTAVRRVFGAASRALQPRVFCWWRRRRRRPPLRRCRDGWSEFF
ncbi:hypothetical protein F511_41415 [Dorcoceras hygrometricum]|uniref:Uncharacterized protein n=1 Tax=Dorcoceras hygrometricum TaxID=472368 RepID=A0A2Z7BML0_9LAMI|nr:hypothetical protein F511_41415 [Dorcoceras hygrometricum]